jgi:hypothetical protein
MSLDVFVSEMLQNIYDPSRKNYLEETRYLSNPRQSPYAKITSHQEVIRKIVATIRSLNLKVALDSAIDPATTGDFDAVCGYGMREELGGLRAVAPASGGIEGRQVEFINQRALTIFLYKISEDFQKEVKPSASLVNRKIPAFISSSITVEEGLCRAFPELEGSIIETKDEYNDLVIRIDKSFLDKAEDLLREKLQPGLFELTKYESLYESLLPGPKSYRHSWQRFISAAGAMQTLCDY